MVRFAGSRFGLGVTLQRAELEAVAFSCTGRRLARAANGLGSRGIMGI